jgi:quercetin dioxygenase-like cupin family protein
MKNSQVSQESIISTAVFGRGGLETVEPRPKPKGTPRGASAIPADDLRRKLTAVQPDDNKLPHLSVAGDTYTVLVSGNDTSGRHCLIDMYIPPGGGPPPHRHNFEETFTMLEGEIALVFRGEKLMARAGATVNIPANAPHSFKNASSRPARLLCMCSPAGLEQMFKRVGDPVNSRTAAPPGLSDTEKAERLQRAQVVASEFQTELLIP